MKITTLLFACLSLHAGDTYDGKALIGRARVNPATMKVGERACVFGFVSSEERHVWVFADSFTRNSGYCVFDIAKTADGWRLWLHGIPLGVEGKDSEKKSLGMIRVTEVIP